MSVCTTQLAMQVEAVWLASSTSVTEASDAEVFLTDAPDPPIPVEPTLLLAPDQAIERVAGEYRILVVEDSRADVFLIREALAQADICSEISLVSDGEKAIEFIAGVDSEEDRPVPDLVLLDLNLPRRSGAEVLAEIRHSRRCAATPVLIVTSSDSERDHEETTRFGASAYFRKPSSYAGFMKLGDAVRQLLALGKAFAIVGKS